MRPLLLSAKPLDRPVRNGSPFALSCAAYQHAMNIAYHGSFFSQTGLEQLGHNILSIPADDIDINLRLKKILASQLILWIIEPYGSSSFSVRELALPTANMKRKPRRKGRGRNG